MTHTATPWRFQEQTEVDTGGNRIGFQAGEIFANGTPAIATCHTYEGGDGFDGARPVKAKPVEALANAEFIVRACNAHDQLVTALQSVVKMMGWGEHSISDTARRALSALKAAEGK